MEKLSLDKAIKRERNICECAQEISEKFNMNDEEKAQVYSKIEYHKQLCEWLTELNDIKNAEEKHDKVVIEKYKAGLIEWLEQVDGIIAKDYAVGLFNQIIYDIENYKGE